MNLLDRSAILWRRVVRGVRRRLFPRSAYRKVPLRTRTPRRDPAVAPPPGLDWRSCLPMTEVGDATPAHGLFKRRFGRAIPAFPRHFVMRYAADGQASQAPVIAYLHEMWKADVHLLGGLCVDERAYRALPKWLLAQVRDQGGLATIMTRGTVALLEGSAPVLGYVGDLRSRQAALRAGFVDTDDPHLMAHWPAPLSDEEKRRRVANVAALGPF